MGSSSPYFKLETNSRGLKLNVCPSLRAKRGSLLHKQLDCFVPRNDRAVNNSYDRHVERADKESAR